MDTKLSMTLDCEARDVADVAQGLFGFAPEVSAGGGVIVIHPRPQALTAAQIETLTMALKAAKLKTPAEKRADEAATLDSKRATVKALLAMEKPTLAELTAGVKALAELLG